MKKLTLTVIASVSLVLPCFAQQVQVAKDDSAPVIQTDASTQFAVLFSISNKKLRPISAVTHDFLRISKGDVKTFKIQDVTFTKPGTETFFTLLGGLSTNATTGAAEGGFGAGFRFAFNGGGSSFFAGTWFEELDLARNRWTVGFTIRG